MLTSLVVPVRAPIVNDMWTTYDDIDRELIILQEATRRLQSQRNMLSTACKLPVEILSMIFLCFADREPPRGPADFHGPRIKNWYGITHVCRKWREVALGCPTLWNRIDVTSPHWVPEMVLRSKQGTISLRAEVYDTPSKRPKVEACKSILSDPARIRELHLAGDRSSLKQLTSPLNGERVASLRSLIIHSQHWRHDLDVFQLSESFISAGAPHLEHLELGKCAIPWDAPLLLTSASLTTLIVHGVRRADCRPSAGQLLRVLSSMSALRHLFLEDTLPTSDEDPDLAEAPLRLEALRTLCLKGTFIECALFLPHLALSPSISATFRCRDPRTMSEIVDFSTSFAQARKNYELGLASSTK